MRQERSVCGANNENQYSWDSHVPLASPQVSTVVGTQVGGSCCQQAGGQLTPPPPTMLTICGACHDSHYTGHVWGCRDGRSAGHMWGLP